MLFSPALGPSAWLLTRAGPCRGGVTRIWSWCDDGVGGEAVEEWEWDVVGRVSWVHYGPDWVWGGPVRGAGPGPGGGGLEMG